MERGNALPIKYFDSSPSLFILENWVIELIRRTRISMRLLKIKLFFYQIYREDKFLNDIVKMHKVDPKIGPIHFINSIKTK
jgi:hypothetical protein